MVAFTNTEEKQSGQGQGKNEFRIGLVGEAESNHWNYGRQCLESGMLAASEAAVLRNGKVQSDKEDATPWKWSGPGPEGCGCWMGCPHGHGSCPRQESTFADMAALPCVTAQPLAPPQPLSLEQSETFTFSSSRRQKYQTGLSQTLALNVFGEFQICSYSYEAFLLYNQEEIARICSMYAVY